MCRTTKMKNEILSTIKETGIILTREEKDTLFEKYLNNYTEYNIAITKDTNKVKTESININDIYVTKNSVVETNFKRRVSLLMEYRNSHRIGFINSYANEDSIESSIRKNSSEFPEREKQIFLIEDTNIYRGRKERKLEVLVYIAE